MGHARATSDLDHHLHCLTSYCLPNLQRLLAAIDPQSLTETQLGELEEFDFHYFPEVGLHSVTFVNGRQAVAVLRGIREGRWTREAVQGAIAQRML